MDWDKITGNELIGFSMADKCAAYAQGFYSARRAVAALGAICDRDGTRYEDNDQYRHFVGAAYHCASLLYQQVKAFQDWFRCETYQRAIARIQNAADILADEEAFTRNMADYITGERVDIGTAAALAPNVIKSYLADMAKKRDGNARRLAAAARK